MAGLRDFSHAIKTVGPLRLAGRVYAEINTDNVFTNAAAMAYAWIFAIFPLIIFLMTLVPYLPNDLREKTPTMITDAMYGAGMQYAIVGPVEDVIKPLLHNTHGGLLSFGLLLTLYAASGGMNTTMAGLDAAFDVDKPRSFVFKRLMAMALTMFMGIAFLIVMLLLPIGSLAEKILDSNVQKLPPHLQNMATGPLPLVLTIARYAAGLMIIQMMIGVLYFAGPSRWQRPRLLSPGAVFTAVGWLVTGWGLRLYFAHFNSYNKTYGAVAGMVITLLTFYLDATIILIGAELNNEIDKARRGKFAGNIENEGGQSPLPVLPGEG